ncbi:hypothetical protein B0J14DRAFT_585434 [Halenospora varia]|nr:hypothetical protein B0J14DRAFT_585434 [Halenospora varia]
MCRVCFEDFVSGASKMRISADEFCRSTAAAIVRTVITCTISYGTKLGFRDLLSKRFSAYFKSWMNHADASSRALGISTNTAVWSLVEAGAAVTGASLPTLRPLLPVLQRNFTDPILDSFRSIFSLRSEARGRE